ncbi:hypothetical protein [Candidatus Mycoplasma haematohominis]|uniref:hypothetical protein n=1 Tax=Candidatus Mycoplasma haematohominis TaxID=1494318 RepID=UPI001C0A6AF8|nr:hypothetical protein [Candidatus Mycoplasma haemohominis]
MTPAKGAAAIGAGSVLIGGGYLGYEHLSVSCTTIDKSGNKANYSNGIAKEDLDKFVDPLLDSNKKWWEKAYLFLKRDKESKSETISSQFNAVTHGFQKDEASSTHLNKVCETAIKTTTINSKYLKNVWTYCSIEPVLASKKGNEPEVKKTLKTQENPTFTSGQLGFVNENKDQLASADQANEEWWNWVYENRLKPIKEDETKKTTLHSDFSGSTVGYDDTTTTALNKVCEAKYKETKDKFPSSASDADEQKNKLKKNVESFCVRGGQGNLTIPTN